MATLVLSGLGAAFGGPLGQAFGAIVGNQIDHAVFGGGEDREGPRLKELALTTSSYGQPLPRQFGQMRVGGTVIWATDIKEASSSEGGGKGQPSTTTYSYSASFAVALSSTPISGIGRIWADGNLLRGADGDLKVEGIMRIHLGDGDGAVDPIIAADRGIQAPAFRDCAYIVFENLALADFGNRIPSLTFEIFGKENEVSLSQIVPEAVTTTTEKALPYTLGYADEGGGTSRALAAINRVLPLACVTGAEGMTIAPITSGAVADFTLSEELAADDNPDGPERGNRRAEGQSAAPLAIRYYDQDRDYQPGVQRAVGMRPNGIESMVDLPATMTSDGAKRLANDNAQRARWRKDRVTRRIGSLDTRIAPGSLTRIPDSPGVWRVLSWEWLDRGVELELERVPPANQAQFSSDPGDYPKPVDVLSPETILDLFEVPNDGTSELNRPIVLAAATSQSAAWRGAQLYAEQGSSLTSITQAAPRRAVVGQLAAPLGGSNSLLLEPNAKMSVELAGDGLGFEPTDVAGLANGRNRLMVAGEILQFLGAQQTDERTWELTGLLRGRGGTEDAASLGHAAGAAIVLLDNRLTTLSAPSLQAFSGSRIAAIGRGDTDAVFAELRNAGLSQRPLFPVHPRKRVLPNGDWEICWTRRARGTWLWQDQVEAPLVEETEQYFVGLGDTQDPFEAWTVSYPKIVFSHADLEGLRSQYGAAPLWVRQIGTFSASPALFLADIS